MEHGQREDERSRRRHFHRDMPERISVELSAKGERACKSPRDESRKSKRDHVCDRCCLQ